MEKLNYIKLVFLSWWKDMHSKKKIIKNNWHKHITYSIVFIMSFTPLLKASFKMDEALWFQYFVLLFVPLCLYWGFERVQGMYANYKGHERPDQLESDKDVVASWVISSIIGVLLYTFLLK